MLPQEIVLTAYGSFETSTPASSFKASSSLLSPSASLSPSSLLNLASATTAFSASLFESTVKTDIPNTPSRPTVATRLFSTAVSPIQESGASAEESTVNQDVLDNLNGTLSSHKVGNKVPCTVVYKDIRPSSTTVYWIILRKEGVTEKYQDFFGGLDAPTQYFSKGELSPGQIGMAYSQKYGNWFRCLVQKKKKDDSLWKVLYIDFGNHDLVESVGKLPSDKADVPALPNPCTLIEHRSSSSAEQCLNSCIQNETQASMLITQAGKDYAIGALYINDVNTNCLFYILRWRTCIEDAGEAATK